MSKVLEQEAPAFTAPLFVPESWLDLPSTEERATIPAHTNSPYVGLDGRVYGRLVSKGAQFLNTFGVRRVAPMQLDAYTHTMTKGKWVLTESGDKKHVNDVAVISLATGHCPLDITDPDRIRAWYDGGGPQRQHADDATSAMFHVRYHVADDGIWYAGAVAPHRDTLDCILAASSAPSGEWMELQGDAYPVLLGACMVSSEGFRGSIKKPGTPVRMMACFSQPGSPRFVSYGHAERIQAGYGAVDIPEQIGIRLQAAVNVGRWVRWGESNHGLIVTVGEGVDPDVVIQPYRGNTAGDDWEPQDSTVTVKGSKLSEWEEHPDASRMFAAYVDGEELARAIDYQESVAVWREEDRFSLTDNAEVIVNGQLGRYIYVADASNAAGEQLHIIEMFEGPQSSRRIYATESEIKPTGKIYRLEFRNSKDVLEEVVEGEIATSADLTPERQAILLDAIVQSEALAGVRMDLFEMRQEMQEES